ncbi:MAG: aldo/keto reductase, partial [Gammaproteobacteria bacterium]|nr:aldo/keto reductase [Gammaproteobacteria bacterium]
QVIDALKEISEETGYTIPQISLQWLLQRPTVASVLIGARNETQLQDNLKAKDIYLSHEHVEKLNQASAIYPAYPYYPYWNGQFTERFKSIVDSQFIRH